MLLQESVGESSRNWEIDLRAVCVTSPDVPAKRIQALLHLTGNGFESMADDKALVWTRLTLFKDE